MSETESAEIRSDMTPEDWQDIAESEFRDVVKSPVSGKVAFVFEHEDIGLHGFQFIESTGTLKPCGFEEVGE